jgi:transcriptional regulator with XRE-family HTH domain
VEQELLEMNLQELRKAAGVTQADVATKTGMAQADVSRTESREDHRLSTLRRYVEALGGELEVNALVNGRRVRLVASSVGDRTGRGQRFNVATKGR